MKRLAVFTLIFLLSLSFFLSNAYAITDCTHITSSGIYELDNDIYATTPSISNICILIDSPNVVLNLNNYGIYNRNSSILSGIVTSESNVYIMNGIVSGFLGEQNENIGIAIICNVVQCSNVNITNVQIINSTVGLFLNNVTNSNFFIAADNPTGKIGINALQVSNTSINAFARAKLYGGIFENVTDSFISGTYDTNIIFNENVTETGGNFFYNFLGTYSYALFPPITKTGVVSVQSKGIGVMIWNNTNTVYQDITATGLIQGISAEKSQRNYFARIELPMTGKFVGGKFGGLYLGQQAINNTLCEIKGYVFDNCGQLLSSSTCRSKANIYLDSCANIFNPFSFGEKQTMQDVFLTPLFNINIPAYQWITFLSTPFFITMVFMVGISAIIAHYSKPEFGIFSLIIIVMFLAIFKMVTLWFALIFIIIIGYVLIKVMKFDFPIPFKKKESA